LESISLFPRNKTILLTVFQSYKKIKKIKKGEIYQPIKFSLKKKNRQTSQNNFSILFLILVNSILPVSKKRSQGVSLQISLEIPSNKIKNILFFFQKKESKAYFEKDP